MRLRSTATDRRGEKRGGKKTQDQRAAWLGRKSAKLAMRAVYKRHQSRQPITVEDAELRSREPDTDKY
eukprot:scaffold240_cov243-Pinguiococcus_pyrenoidosus.AAC.10